MDNRGKAGRRSGDNVRNKLVFQHPHPVLQRQLFALKPRDLQLVRQGFVLQRLDGCIKITMLYPQQFELLANTFVVHTATHKPPRNGWPAPIARSVPFGALSTRQTLIFMIYLHCPIMSRDIPAVRLSTGKEKAVNQGHVSALQSKHAELEAQIELENNRPHPDDDLVHRLKKQKLQIKDALEQELTAA